MREKGLWSGTATTSHSNIKVWDELTIFFKTRTLGHFLVKSHGCYTFHQNVWVGHLCGVAYFCLIYIHIPLFLMKSHLCPLLLLMNFALNYSVAGIDFRFFKKRNLSYRFFLFTPLRNHQILEQVESYCGKTTWELTRWVLLHSSVLLKIGGKSHAFPMWNTISWESDGKNVPTL